MDENKIKSISLETMQAYLIKSMLDIKHFAPKEYCYSVMFNHWVHIECSEKIVDRVLRKLVYLLHPLLSMMEIVRSEFKSPVIITSGIRDLELWNMLYGAGYHISPTTDHSFGLNYNPYGVGALDHFVVGVPAKEVYEYEKSKFDKEIGQLILYKKSQFIHISNNRSIVFSDKFKSNILKDHKKYIVWDY